MNWPPEVQQDVIERELAQYRAFDQARRAGVACPDRPPLPPSHAPRGFRFALGLALHLVLKTIWLAASAAHAKSVMAWAAKARIEADDLWFEPRACGLNSSLTDLGLALVLAGETQAAIACLDRSWRVHPCPHAVTFGLRRELATRLGTCREAGAIVCQYWDALRLFTSVGRR